MQERISDAAGWCWYGKLPNYEKEWGAGHALLLPFDIFRGLRGSWQCVVGKKLAGLIISFCVNLLQYLAGSFSTI